MKKYMKKIMIFVLALALVIEPQMVKASKYVGKEVNINDYLKNTDDVLYSKLYIDKDYTGELPDGDSIDSHLKYLDKVTVAEGNPKYKSIDGVVYSKDGKQLLLYPVAKNEEGTFEVPKEVTEIGKYAFNDAKISHITLNDNIEKINALAFRKSEIEEFKVPAKITELGDAIFSGCQKLKEVDLNNVTKVGELTFLECTNLKKVVGDKIATVGEMAFYGNQKLTTINLEKATDIGKQAFENCVALKKIDLKSVKTIKAGAFHKTKIASVTLKPGLKLEEKALDSTTKIKYKANFNKIKPYLLYGTTWNAVSGAKGYQVQVTVYGKTKKSKKTLKVNQKAQYVGAYTKLGKQITATAKKLKVKTAAKCKIKIRAYKYKGKKKIYTKWSKTNEFLFK